MSEIKQEAVLELISGTLKKAIIDSKLEKQSASISVIRDGNDTIHIEQRPAGEGNAAGIYITDKKEILYSEDLLDTLQDFDALIVVNGLSIETEFVFQAVKDSFDTLSSSYEFVRTTEKSVTGLTAQFKFGDNKFILNLDNQADEVSVAAKFGEEVKPVIQKTIAADAAKVNQAMNKMFKA